MNDDSKNDYQPVGEHDHNQVQNSGVEELACSRIDRRGFMGGSIAAGTVGVLSAGLFADQSLAGSAAMPFGSLHDLTCQDFQRLVGQSFTVKSLPTDRSLRTESRRNSTMVLTNVVVQDRDKDRHRPKNVRPHGFTLQFSSRGNQNVGEGTYLFGKGMAKTTIFVQPLGQQHSGHDLEYIAIFN